MLFEEAILPVSAESGSILLDTGAETHSEVCGEERSGYIPW